MKGIINSTKILESYNKKLEYLDSWDAITDVIREILPPQSIETLDENLQMDWPEYYHTIFQIWSICEKSKK